MEPEGAVIDVDGDVVFVTLYSVSGNESSHHENDDEGYRDALINALVLIERLNPGVLHDAVNACRPDDTHNPNPEGLAIKEEDK